MGEQPTFRGALEGAGRWPLRRGPVETLQLNIGRRCNQACHHCHVEAGPQRRETMSRGTAERVVELLDGRHRVRTLDITGGAPELNRCFRFLVREASRRGLRVIDRCNLTVLEEPGQEDTAEFLARHRVEIVASLPCYRSQNVDRQRGSGVFERSIRVLQQLNGLGYAQPGSELRLDLVFNPGGASLPPSQSLLEESYKQQLGGAFGVRFNRLLTLTNMPIRRFADELARTGQSEAYQALLVQHFNPNTVAELMCTGLLSIGYDGALYDCDFNQMLEMPPPSGPRTIWQLEGLGELEDLPIATGRHCFGCTAGSGSSCGGELAPDPVT